MMAALKKPRRRHPVSLSDAERAMMACLSDMLESADAVTISRRRVAIIVDAARFDRFNELVDIAVSGDGREAGSDDDDCLADLEPSLGSLNEPTRVEVTGRDAEGRATGFVRVEGTQESWGYGGTDDREEENEHGDEGGGADSGFVSFEPFRMDQTEQVGLIPR